MSVRIQCIRMMKKCHLNNKQQIIFVIANSPKMRYFFLGSVLLHIFKFTDVWVDNVIVHGRFYFFDQGIFWLFIDFSDLVNHIALWCMYINTIENQNAAYPDSRVEYRWLSLTFPIVLVEINNIIDIRSSTIQCPSGIKNSKSMFKKFDRKNLEHETSFPPKLSKAQGHKDFWETSKPCQVGIHRIALAEYSQMSTHMQGFQSFLQDFSIILY